MSDGLPPDSDIETDLQAERFQPGKQLLRLRPELQWTDRSGDHQQKIDGVTVVGAAPRVDLVVDDAAVSRIHAELEPRKDGLWIRDLDSRNGTYVEGVLVKAACVPDGGRIRLGNATVLVRYGAVRPCTSLWPSEDFGPMVGKSAVMRELFSRLADVAPLDATVLVQGETGSGKELVARAVHQASPRRDNPYVVVDCASLPEALLEAELFGHAKGAFTGALGARAGALEAADGGTVFLDEIGELPLSVQPKLLRAIETRCIRRIGESDYRSIDVRFISATHRDLRTMVNAGAFREDLYFRVAVLPLRVPSLRERPEDIALLVQRFLPPSSSPPSATLVRELIARPWLGNVRELRNFVQRAQAFGAEAALDMSKAEGLAVGGVREVPADEGLPPARSELPFKEVRKRWNEHLERSYLAQLLERHGRNMRAVADAAGLDPTYVYRLVRKHEL